MNYFEPHLTPDELRAISAIGLAHMGDAVYETLVRTWLCVHGKATGKELHRATIALVCAQKQAEVAQRVLPQLTEEVLAVYKRGRMVRVICGSYPTEAEAQAALRLLRRHEAFADAWVMKK